MIKIHEDNYKKLIMLAKTVYAKYKTEVSGFGFVKEDGDDLLITDIILPEQSANSSAETNIDHEALSKVLEEHTNKRDEGKLLRLWWHSHHVMGVKPSGTDDETFNTFSYLPYMISIIINNVGNIYCRFDVYKPARIGGEVEIKIISPDMQALETECIKLIDEKVSKPAYKYIKSEPVGKMSFFNTRESLETKDNYCEYYDEFIKKYPHMRNFSSIEMNILLNENVFNKKISKYIKDKNIKQLRNILDSYYKRLENLDEESND